MPAESAGEAPKMSPQESVKKALSILNSLAQAPATPPSSFEPTIAVRSSPSAQCQPWSKQDYFVRLKSFSAATWFDKPAPISASECARHGWTNEGPDRLRCDSCKRKLTFTIHGSLTGQSKDNVVRKFQEQLAASGHSALCPWKDNPVPEALLSLPGSSSHEVMGAFKKRLRTLLRCRVLPDVDPDFTSGEAVGKVLEACGWGRRKPVDAGVLLAACGWEVERAGGQLGGEGGELLEESEALLVCGEDQRRAGIWNFRASPYRPSQALAQLDLVPSLPNSALGKRRLPPSADAADDAEDAGGGGGAGEAEGDGGDIFRDASKRARVLGGALPSAAFGFEPTASATFGQASFGGSRSTSWGLLSPQVERISLGHSWAQQPLGALVQPAPSVENLKRKLPSFHPLQQHRNASPWLSSSLPLLSPASLPSPSLRSAPAWQQSLAIVLKALSPSPSSRLISNPSPSPTVGAKPPAQAAVATDDGGAASGQRNAELVGTAQSNMRRWLN